MKRIQIGIIGTGWIGEIRAHTCARHPLVEGLHLAETDEARLRRVAKDTGARTATTDYRELLTRKDVEAVLVATSGSHREAALRALAAGKHVFVEKPFTLLAADAVKAAAACQAAGVVLAVGHSRRRQPTNRKLKAMLQAKELGVPIQAECNLSAGAALGYKPGFWRADRAESPAGGMAGLGVHHVDTLQYLLGPIARVMAMSKRLAAPVDLDDATAILLEFERGPLGFLGTCLVLPKVLYLNVYGTEANVHTEGEGAKFFVQKKGTEEKVSVPMAPVDIIGEELEDFARAVGFPGIIAHGMFTMGHLATSLTEPPQTRRYESIPGARVGLLLAAAAVIATLAVILGLLQLGGGRNSSGVAPPARVDPPARGGTAAAEARNLSAWLRRHSR